MALCGTSWFGLAQAVGLGDAETSSRLGQLLHARIAVQANVDEEISADCIRLEGPRRDAGEDLPWLRTGRLRLESRNGKPVIIVSSVDTISSPILMFAIRVDCGTALRREYTLLLNPAEVVDTPASRPSAPIETPPSPNAGTLRTTQGETLQSIAGSLFPNDRGLQARYITMLRQQNPGKLNTFQNHTPLPPNTELAAPEIGAVMNSAATPAAQTLAPRPVQASSLERKNTPRPVAERPAPRPQPRLVLGRGDSSLQMATQLEGRKELSEVERERLRTELQLIATLDEKIATQLELSEKLRQLEALQTRLQSDVQALESKLQAQQSALVPAADSTLATSASVAGSAPAASTAPTIAITPKVIAQKPGLESAFPWWVITALASAIVGALVLVWLKWRTRTGTDNTASNLSPQPESAQASETAADNLFEPLSEDDIWPDLAPGKSPATRPELADLPSLSEHGPASVLHIVEDVEEHDSAVELAEIMLSFGRVQGAAQTLADYIRANPLQAVKPWVKLLEVYKAGDMRAEFEALTLQLNKTFNVKPVAWDDFEIAMRAPESLEHIPHVQERLCRVWGTRECQAWLHQLLRDNRQGTRQGFPLAIVDEILLLLAILEASLGPYRPEHDPEQETPLTALPATVATTTTRLTETTLTRNASPTFPDLELGTETADLTRTLHINLDDLPDSDDTRTSMEPRRLDLD
ncbi:hypothetical protein GCM10025770_03390 [Viridibacterium curvum]|uniref:FimV N-terminal domain-containing protein n=1 Tax=Viridibacterium curvum TaxID=1101404 RepID=A0ABP9Q8Z2_9RHOO